jgi:hypothetical protein
VCDVIHVKNAGLQRFFQIFSSSSKDFSVRVFDGCWRMTICQTVMAKFAQFLLT